MRVKNSFDGLFNKLETAEGMISRLDGRSIEITQSETQRGQSK